MKIGCEFFMETEGDASFVSVETGVPGLFVDLRPNEAVEYICKRETLLQEKISRIERYINEVNLHIQALTQRFPGNTVDIQEPINN